MLKALSPYTAAFRDADYEPQQAVQTSTLCWDPTNSRDFAARTDDGEFESVFRCRKCAGCRNYENLVLRRRLAHRYGKERRPVWISEYQSETMPAGVLSSRVARRRPRTFEHGMLRTGPGSIAKIQIGSRPQRTKFPRGNIQAGRIYKITKPASVHAWRHVTRGMKLRRAELGEWQNRYYLVGLEPVKEQSFILELHGGLRKRHPEARADARAYRRGLVLYPSEAMIARTALARVLAQTSARGARFTTNRRRPTAVVRILDPAARRSDEPRPGKTQITRIISSDRDAGSLTPISDLIPLFMSKMRKPAPDH